MKPDRSIMQKLCTNTLVVVVVALAAVRSYLALATHSVVLPQHTA
jgi:hypothetical protein